MKNFIRAMKFAWPYRFRLLFSVVFAAAAAVFWSLNFTAIYPVLKIRGSEQTLKQGIDTEIEQTKKDITKLRGQIALKNEVQQKYKSRAKRNDRKTRALSRDRAKRKPRREVARHTLYRMQ